MLSAPSICWSRWPTGRCRGHQRTYTALTCLDYLGHGLAVIAQRGEEERNTYDAQGRLRLTLEPVTFGEVLDAAFDMLRHAGAANATVLLHMVDTFGVVGREATWPEARRALSRHAGLILEESRISPLIEGDRRRICQGVDALQAQLVAAR